MYRVLIVGSFLAVLGSLLWAQSSLNPQKIQPIVKRPLLRIIKTREELIAYVETLNVDLVKMNGNDKAIYDGFLALGQAAEKLSSASKELTSLLESGNASADQLLNATKQMQETQMSFNLQYLQLQSQMQNENRSYTAVSNIMKTKHDTVKNSIQNVR